MKVIMLMLAHHFELCMTMRIYTRMITFISTAMCCPATFTGTAMLLLLSCTAMFIWGVPANLCYTPGCGSSEIVSQVYSRSHGNHVGRNHVGRFMHLDLYQVKCLEAGSMGSMLCSS